MSQIEKLCDILLPQNLNICKSIASGKFSQRKLLKYFQESAQEIKLFKKAMSHRSLSAESPMTKEERSDQYQNKEYEKLVTRMEKIKNDKKWSKIISRLNRLKPVEPVVVPDPEVNI